MGKTCLIVLAGKALTVFSFALRGDWSSEKDRKAMDEAEKQGIEWFKKYLS